MAHRSDDEIIRTTHNLARFCVENRAISWVLLVGVLVWGVFGYARMPKRKDPDVPVREAVAICPWPGVNAQQVEQMVTRKIEATIAQNSFIHPAGASTNYGIRSVTLDGVAIVYIQLDEKLADAAKQFNDINLKLNSIDDLPSGTARSSFRAISAIPPR